MHVLKCRLDARHDLDSGKQRGLKNLFAAPGLSHFLPRPHRGKIALTAISDKVREMLSGSAFARALPLAAPVRALADLLEQLAAERRKVGGLAAGHDALVGHDLLIDPRPSGGSMAAFSEGARPSTSSGNAPARKRVGRLYTHGFRLVAESNDHIRDISMRWLRGHAGERPVCRRRAPARAVRALLHGCKPRSMTQPEPFKEAAPLAPAAAFRARGAFLREVLEGRCPERPYTSRTGLPRARRLPRRLAQSSTTLGADAFGGGVPARPAASLSGAMRLPG